MDSQKQEYKEKIYKILKGRGIEELDRHKKRLLKKTLIDYLDYLQRNRDSIAELKKWYTMLKKLASLKDRILIDGYLRFLDSDNAKKVYKP